MIKNTKNQIKFYTSTINRSINNKQVGFVAIWVAILSLGLIIGGLTFLQILNSYTNKVALQNDALTISTMGGLNAETTSKESLNLMAAGTKMLYGNVDVEAIDTAQVMGNTKVLIKHFPPTDNTRGYVVTAISKDFGPISKVVSSLGGTKVSGAAQAGSAAPFVSIGIDVSQSLRGNGKTDLILQGFGVLDPSNPNVRGPNGVCLDSNYVEVASTVGMPCPLGSTIHPNKYIQTLIPGSFEEQTRALRPWNSISAAFPQALVTADLSSLVSSSCLQSSENDCGAGIGFTHQGALSLLLPDLYYKYKVLAGLVYSLIASITPRHDLLLVGGIRNNAAVNFFNSAFIGDGSTGSAFVQKSTMDPWTIWRFDEPTYGNYSIVSGAGVGQPWVQAEVLESFNWDKPRNVFKDGVSLGPHKLDEEFNTSLILYRKLNKYAAIRLDGPSGDEIVAPGTFENLFTPPMPIVESENYDLPTDSGVYDPMYGLPGFENTFDQTNKFGISYWPSPLYMASGNAFPSRPLPPSLINLVEYNNKTHPNGIENSPASNPANPGFKASCSGGGIPTCAQYPGDTTFLFPDSGTQAGAINPEYLRCIMHYGDGTVVCPPGQNLVLNNPLEGGRDRGVLEFPASSLSLTDWEMQNQNNMKTTPFHMLFDSSMIQGGTWMNLWLLDAIKRAEAFGTNRPITPVAVLVTDGVPKALGENSSPVKGGDITSGNFAQVYLDPSTLISTTGGTKFEQSDTWAMSHFELLVNYFTNVLKGHIFVWYIATQTYLERYTNGMAEILPLWDPAISTVFQTALDNNTDADCSALPLGTAQYYINLCNQLNNTVRPEAAREISNSLAFKNMMQSGTYPNVHWIETGEEGVIGGGVNAISPDVKNGLAGLAMSLKGLEITQ